MGGLLRTISRAAADSGNEVAIFIALIVVITIIIWLSMMIMANLKKYSKVKLLIKRGFILQQSECRLLLNKTIHA